MTIIFSMHSFSQRFALDLAADKRTYGEPYPRASFLRRAAMRFLFLAA